MKPITLTFLGVPLVCTARIGAPYPAFSKARRASPRCPTPLLSLRPDTSDDEGNYGGAVNNWRLAPNNVKGASNGGDVPKRKRGRPKGSKNKRSKLNSGVGSDASGVARATAPNGLPGQGPADLLPELLPLLAKDEVRAMEDEREDERAARAHIRDLMADLSARNRMSSRWDNLRPFALQADAVVCDACDGEGMTKCSYCHGEGFVDFGPDNRKFFVDFPDGDMVLPKCVTGTIFHCPLCGGFTQERCVKCLGVGELRDASSERRSGAARKMRDDKMWHVFSEEDMLAQYGDRVEIGLDGLTIVRAKKQNRPGRPRKKKSAELDVKAKTDLKENAKEDAQISGDDSVSQMQTSAALKADVKKENTKVLQTSDANAVSVPVASTLEKKRRGRPPRSKIKVEEDEQQRQGPEVPVQSHADAMTPRKKKRGRPPKAKIMQVEQQQPVEGLQWELQSQRESELQSEVESQSRTKDVVRAQRSRNVRFAKPSGAKQDEAEPSTDFVNTTDYQVSRRLRKLHANSRNNSRLVDPNEIENENNL